MAPTISLFYGIKITINYDDHAPPHFHAAYAEADASVGILDATLLKGFLPKRQMKIVLAWAELHKDELMQAWAMAKDHEPPARIEPLH